MRGLVKAYFPALRVAHAGYSRGCLFFAFLLLAAPAYAEDLPVWRNGTVAAAADAGIIFMAAQGGFDRRFGIKIDMQTAKGDPILLKAMLAGQLDSYEGGPGSPMVAASKGAGVRVIACHWPKQDFTLWARAGIGTLADLRGKAIGVSAPGSAPDNFIHAALDASHIPASEVHFVSVGTPPELLRSMAAGVIDAGAMNNNLDPRAREMGLSKLATSDEVSPLAVRRCINTTVDALAHRHADVVRFLAAEMAAYAFALSHRDEVLAMTREIAHIPASAAEPEVAFDDVVTRHTVSLDFGVPMDRLDYLKSVLVQTGQLSQAFDPASIVDTGPLLEARALLAGSAPVVRGSP
jgi:NitT/TauT family transport system substrate-binding protein